MKRFGKRFLTTILTVAMIFSGISAKAFAATDGQKTIAVEDKLMTVKGSNSLGNLLSQELMQEAEEQMDNNGYNVFSVEIEETTATVSFETLQDCSLVVAIYDEEETSMLAVGNKEVLAGETEVEVELETDEMPEYFDVKAYLIETETLRPLCTVYESSMYTQEMQEFLKKTTEDFDEEKVVNLDDNTTTNFLVCAEDTKVIAGNETTNRVTSVDDTNSIYVIENADESVTALQEGDVFVYSYGEDQILVVKVAGIALDGATVTITGEDTSMDEVFDYVRIEGETTTEDIQIDPEGCEGGIVYNGLLAKSEVNAVHAGNTGNTENTIGNKSVISDKLEANFSFLEEKVESPDGTMSAEISGTLGISIGSEVDIYLTLEQQYIKLKLDYGMTLGLKIEGKIETAIPLTYFRIDPVPGVVIEFKPAVVFRLSASIEYSNTLSGSIGFEASKKGVNSLCSAPQMEAKVQIEGTFFVGISLQPSISLIHKSIATAELTAEAGVEIKASYAETAFEEDIEDLKKTESVIHLCDNCIEGTLTAKAEISFEVSFLELEELTFKKTIGIADPIGDFYYSIDHKEFEFGKCPHCIYKVTILVQGRDGKPIEGAQINGGEITGKNGMLSYWYENGIYEIVAAKDKYEIAQKELVVEGKSKKFPITLERLSSGVVELENFEYGTVRDVKMAYHLSAAITTGDDLYMWGNNGYGQIGNGLSETTQDTPVRVLGNVRDVYLRDENTAAITKDGSLYMWGNNGYGQVGNETTGLQVIPFKVMDDVKEVWMMGLGRETTAIALANDGSLYAWGFNEKGQVGNGTYVNQYLPVKVLDNVAEVKIGGNSDWIGARTAGGDLYLWGNVEDDLVYGGATSTPTKVLSNVASFDVAFGIVGAIKTDGCLYTWGYNSNGQLGDGTTEESLTPIKVLENVKSVTVGYACGAVTNDGSLYMWGNNSSYQVGNGTTENQQTPLKVLENVDRILMQNNRTGAITTDNTYYEWGAIVNVQWDTENTYQYITKPREVMKNVKDVAYEGGHAGIVTLDGDLYMWGNNIYGQLGSVLRNKSDKSYLKVLENVEELCLSQYGTSAITTDGNLYTWGQVASGRGQYTESAYNPVKIMDDAVTVKSEALYTNILLEDGSLYGLGYEEPDGLEATSYIPRKILDKVAKVDGYAYHNSGVTACRWGAITEDGSFYIWSYDAVPVKVLDHIIDFSLNGPYLALSEDGTVYMIESKYNYEIDGYDYTSKSIMENAKSIHAWNSVAGVIGLDGSLYMWGNNSQGQIGNGTTTRVDEPFKVLDNVKSVEIGNTCGAITTDGQLYMWGNNDYGQVGNGTRTDQKTPVKILDNVTDLDIEDRAGQTSGAVTTAGEVYMWGKNDRGQVGNGTTTHQSSPQLVVQGGMESVFVYELNTISLTPDGSMLVWGDNNSGQIGNGSTYGTQTTPYYNKLEVESVDCTYFANYYETDCTIMAVLPNGNLYTFGSDFYGTNGTTSNDAELGILYPIMKNVKEACFDGTCGFAVLDDGRVYTWGKGSSYGYSNKIQKPLIPKKKTIVLAGSSKLMSAAMDVQTKKFSDLTPNGTYNFYIMKNHEAKNKFSADNLYYIEQAIADSEGNISITYQLSEAVGEVEYILVSAEYVEETVTLGDANGDNTVDANDALDILKHVAMMPVNYFDSIAADANKDENINAEDALMVLKHVANMIQLQ